MATSTQDNGTNPQSPTPTEERNATFSMINFVGMELNLGRDPEMRYVQTGNGETVAVCDLRGANTRRRRNGKAKTSWFDVTVWAGLAENCNRALQKGSVIFVQGILDEQTWDDKETGKKRSKTVILAEDVRFLRNIVPGFAQQGGPDVSVEDLPL